jgi:hypothetical protein
MGLSIDAQQQSLSVTGVANVSLTAQQELLALINNVRGKANARGHLDSQVLDIQQNSVVTKADANVILNGLQSIINISDVLVWGLVPDNQNPGWVDINDTQTGNWVPVQNMQSGSWGGISTPSTTTWTDIDDRQPNNWDDVIN